MVVRTRQKIWRMLLAMMMSTMMNQLTSAAAHVHLQVHRNIPLRMAHQIKNIMAKLVF
jgi:hypothetical protein